MSKQQMFEMFKQVKDSIRKLAEQEGQHPHNLPTGFWGFKVKMLDHHAYSEWRRQTFSPGRIQFRTAGLLWTVDQLRQFDSREFSVRFRRTLGEKEEVLTEDRYAEVATAMEEWLNIAQRLIAERTIS